MTAGAHMKPYPEYKDSGMSWTGSVPAHWGVQRTKYLAEIKKRIAGTLGHDVLSVTQRGIRVKDIESGAGQLAMDYSKYQLVEPGDFAMNHMDLLTGFIDISEQAGVTSPDYRVFSLRTSSYFARYYLYIYQMAYIHRIFYSLGQGSAHLGRWRLPRDNFENYLVPVPPLPEQEKIAAFLDYETGRMDRLIEKQERLIELLKEKRQAVISHAVTKGLDPDAPTKDSGVEWLGEVPEHWKVGKLGFYSTILSGYAFPSSGFTSNADGTRLLRGINVGVGTLRWDDTAYWTRSIGDGLSEYEMAKGDIVIGMDRPVIGNGVRVARVEEHDLPSLLLQRVASLTPGPTLNPDYVFAILSSAPMFAAHFLPDTTGVSVPHISPTQVNDFVIPVPPIDEQADIASHLHRLDGLHELLMNKAQVQIDILNERRTALISAAVTGKIDVRDWQPPHEEAA